MRRRLVYWVVSALVFGLPCKVWALVVDDFQQWDQRIQLASVGGLEITSAGHARFTARVDQDATDVIIHPGGVLETLDTYKLPDSHPEPEITNVYVYGTWNARDIQSFGVDRAAYIYIGADGQINLERGYEDPTASYNVLAWLDEAQLGGRSLFVAPELDPAVWSVQIEDMGGGACRITAFGPPPVAAGMPNPEDGATDVSRDVVLNWAPGEFAATHNVYFGASLEDVNASAPATLVAEDLARDDTRVDVGRLDFGRTYYWRVDEVNGAPDFTVHAGEIWSFTTEPLAYPIQSVLAASNVPSDEGVGPDRTVDGSGLNENDEHSTEARDMWLGKTASAGPVYIQYEFDRVYKMHEVLVWNYNVIFEPVLGFGLKDVTVEYSTDGAEWLVLGDVQFAQATATEHYAANTVVDLSGAPAKFIKLVVNSNHGVLPQFGLSEVRFLQIPVFAREPQPTSGAADVGVDSVLSWRAGRDAAAHEVYLAAGQDELALVDTVTDSTFAPGELTFGTAYSWRIDEVNEAEATPIWEGDIWTFTTQEYAVIDDMETYDDEENLIFDAWVDGFINETGSTVGYFEAPFAETTVVNSGAQSMPLEYDNSVAPFYSEAEYDVGSLKLETNGADTLRLFVSGQVPDFVEMAEGTILMNAIGNDIWDRADQFRYAYRTLSGDGSMTVRVDAIDGSPDGWVKGGAMIRQNTEPGAVNAFTAVTGGSGDGATFQWRETADTDSSSSRTLTGIAPPYYARIVRAGNTFTGYLSGDGENWEQQGDSSVDVAMTDPVLIGLALTSHNVDQATSAEFADISFTGNVSATWEVAEIGAAQPSGNDIAPLYVALEDTSGNVAVVTHPDENIVARSGWNEWLIPYSDLAGVNLGRVAIMYIGIGDRDNPTADGTGLILIDDIGYGRPAVE